MVGQIELPLERPRRNSLMALRLLSLSAFYRQYALFGRDADLIRRKARHRERNLVTVVAEPLDVAGW
jgi:hypothetical protein